MRTNRLTTLSAALILWIACGSTEPEPETTLDYEPTQWLITGAIDVDALQEGAALSLVLREGGIVTGSLFMPSTVTGANDVNANMAGSWMKSGDTLRFNQVSQTFVSEFDWILTAENLTAADSVNGSFYDIVLIRMF